MLVYGFLESKKCSKNISTGHKFFKKFLKFQNFIEIFHCCLTRHIKFPFYMVNPFVEVKLLIKLCGISWKLLSMLFMKKEVYSQVYNLTCFLTYYNQKQYQTKKCLIDSRIIKIIRIFTMIFIIVS